MDIQNITVILIVTIAFYLLTPGILIKIKGNKYSITLIHAILFSVVIILIQKIFESTKESLGSSCPVPKCVNKSTYHNTVWPWGKKNRKPDNLADKWNGCAPRTNHITKQNPANTVYKKYSKTPIKCPTMGGKQLRAFPYIVYDLPGRPGENAQVDPNKIIKMKGKNRPCMYELSGFCGYANKYDKHGNVIVGTYNNWPKCGKGDRPYPIPNKNVVACLADPQNINGQNVDVNSVRGHWSNWKNPLFNSVKTGGSGPTYYESN